jgi:non-ribosomal peptide synthase protein (TIGR01720 family)
LAAIWAQVLGIEQVGARDNFFELGGDSILSIQIVARANQAGLRLTPKQVFQHPTIADLAAVVGEVAAIQAEQGVVKGPVPFTPVQQWFLAQHMPNPHWFNQSMLFAAPAGLKPTHLEQVVQALLAHHDALRLRFIKEAGVWRQVNAGLDSLSPVVCVDLEQVTENELAAAVERAANQLQASLDVSMGPLLRVGYLDLGTKRPSQLLVVIHHLAVDGVSWRVLLEDLGTAYEQLSRDEAIRLPAKTTSFKQWAERLAAYAQSDALQSEVGYWLTRAWDQLVPLPTDYPAEVEACSMALANSVTVWLDAEQTQALLQQVPSAYHTQINDILLAALAQTLSEWTGSRTVLIELEGHGREDILPEVDLSRTVGWFTTQFPVLLDVGDTFAPARLIPAVKEQLRQVPHRGIGYGLLRYLSSDTALAAQLQALPAAQVSFNYLGQFDSSPGKEKGITLAVGSSGQNISPLTQFSHYLDINGQVAAGQLALTWTFANLYRSETIERLAQRFLVVLQELIAHCLSPKAGGYTPSDFPMAALDEQKLDDLIEYVEFEE